MKKIALPKGEKIFFLGYKIQNSLNDDGIVLSKPFGELYECHLGNYGKGTKEDIEYCKRDALIYFMLARPKIFANTLCRKIRNGSGTYHEYYLLRNCLKEEGIEMPKEITDGDGMNCMIYFNNEPLTLIK